MRSLFSCECLHHFFQLRFAVGHCLSFPSHRCFLVLQRFLRRLHRRFQLRHFRLGILHSLLGCRHFPRHFDHLFLQLFQTRRHIARRFFRRSHIRLTLFQNRRHLTVLHSHFLPFGFHLRRHRLRHFTTRRHRLILSRMLCLQLLKGRLLLRSRRRGCSKNHFGLFQTLHRRRSLGFNVRHSIRVARHFPIQFRQLLLLTQHSHIELSRAQRDGQFLIKSHHRLLLLHPSLRRCQSSLGISHHFISCFNGFRRVCQRLAQISQFLLPGRLHPLPRHQRLLVLFDLSINSRQIPRCCRHTLLQSIHSPLLLGDLFIHLSRLSLLLWSLQRLTTFFDFPQSHFRSLQLSHRLTMFFDHLRLRRALRLRLLDRLFKRGKFARQLFQLRLNLPLSRRPVRSLLFSSCSSNLSRLHRLTCLRHLLFQSGKSRHQFCRCLLRFNNPLGNQWWVGRVAPLRRKIRNVPPQYLTAPIARYQGLAVMQSHYLGNEISLIFALAQLVPVDVPQPNHSIFTRRRQLPIRRECYRQNTFTMRCPSLDLLALGHLPN